MAKFDDRTEYSIDVFQLSEQRALALANSMPEAMIKAIVDEFQNDVPYLGRNLDRYYLQSGPNRILPDQMLSQQIEPGARIALMEIDRPCPPTARPLNAPFYLREDRSGYVYKVDWSPAIIGRNDPSALNNELVSVDLTGLKNSLRVSRRHVELSDQKGAICARTLSPKNESTVIKQKDGSEIVLSDRYIPLEHGDKIHLSRSKLTLLVLFQSAQGRAE